MANELQVLREKLSAAREAIIVMSKTGRLPLAWILSVKGGMMGAFFMIHARGGENISNPKIGLFDVFIIQKFFSCPLEDDSAIFEDIGPVGHL